MMQNVEGGDEMLFKSGPEAECFVIGSIVIGKIKS